MSAAVAGLRMLRRMVAVPTAARKRVSRVVSVLKPQPFWALVSAVQKFRQTTDDEVRRLLARSKFHTPALSYRMQNATSVIGLKI
ncbi:MAG: hypothetical protein R2932_30775 [Caldilineaceae bacterium]